MKMRDEFYDYYNSTDYFNYHMSQANEVVSKGLAVFALTKGDPKQAILVSCNFGRDTDCLAAVASGLAGALNGAASLPKEWIEQVNKATLADPYTNSKRTIEQTADGLLEAYRTKANKLKETLRLMEG
jgi:ADP-ribosylglycohydrolase